MRLLTDGIMPPPGKIVPIGDMDRVADIDCRTTSTRVCDPTFGIAFAPLTLNNSGIRDVSMQNFRLLWAVAISGAAAVLGSAEAAAQTMQVSVGSEYSTGSYGGSGDTTIYEAPLTVRLRVGDWSFKVRAPFASIEGPGGVVPGGADDNGGDRSGPGGGSPDPGENALGEAPGGVSTSGLADISLSATWAHDLGSDRYLDLTARITLPTGDVEKDLGTGETDLGLSAEIGQQLAGGGIYGFGGYKIRGGAARKDGVQFGAGAYLNPLDNLIVGVDAGWAESSLNGLDQSADLTTYASFGLGADWRMSVYALTGLTENAPDFGAGLSLTWRADFRRPTE